MMSFFSEYPEIGVLRRLARRQRVEVYCVGGFLRDQVIGGADSGLADLDFAVPAGALKLARAFGRALKGTFVLLDQDAGRARVVKRSGQILRVYDFADFQGKTLVADIKKRDFTLNALALNLLTCEDAKPVSCQVRDFFHGREDIKKKRIRMISPNIFIDDPLRLLRAYSLMAQLGFSLERTTLARARKDRDLVRKAASERVREELFRIFDSPRAAKVLTALDKAGLLALIFPQAEAMRAIGQGGYHHLNVFDHSVCALAQLEELIAGWGEGENIRIYLNEIIGGGHTRRSLLKLACFLHDIGKPDTRKNEAGGRLSFHGHERAGRLIVRAIARNLLMSTRERYALEDMVALHLRPGYISNFKKPPERMVFRFMRDAKKEAVSVLLLSIADQRATRGPLTTDHDIQHHGATALGLIDRYFSAQQITPVAQLISGDDLIGTLKLKPGPAFAKILKAVAEARHLGRVNDKGEALALAEKLAKDL